MAKFTLTFYTDEDEGGDRGDKIAKVAFQQGMDADGLHEFVRSHVDSDWVTLQFDTEANTCTLVPPTAVGEDDWDRKRLPKSVEDRRKRDEREKAELQRQIDEAVAAIDAEADKQTAYVMGLLRFIEDSREQLNYLKGMAGGGEFEEPYLVGEDEDDD